MSPGSSTHSMVSSVVFPAACFTASLTSSWTVIVSWVSFMFVLTWFMYFWMTLTSKTSVADCKTYLMKLDMACNLHGSNSLANSA